jgi:hypothetical protein
MIFEVSDEMVGCLINLSGVLGLNSGKSDHAENVHLIGTCTLFGNFSEIIGACPWLCVYS